MKKILRTLGRGVHAPHHKNTAALQTVTMPLPEKLYLVMQQSIGAPCLPTVKKGDTVDVGTVVGKAQGFVGADIHSGASGKVLGIEKLLNPAGAFVDAVVIEPDGQQTIDPAVLPPAIRVWLDGIIKGTPIPYDLERGIALTELLEQAYVSDREQKIVKF